MRKVISRLAGGVVETQRPEIRVSCTSIHETILCGQIYRGEFRLTSENQLAFRGLAYADDSRIEILQGQLAGLTSVVEYKVNAENIHKNTRIRGRFTMVTDAGDLEIPYDFDICEVMIADGRQPKTLDELKDMAEKEPEEALKFFESEGFRHLPLWDNRSLSAVYEGLRRSNSRRQALEEFLVASGEKETVMMQVDTTSRRYLIEEKDGFDHLTVTRNVKGYVKIHLWCEGDFLSLPRSVFRGEDFKDNTCQIPFIIRRKYLHSGLNLGCIRMDIGRKIFTIPIEVMTRKEMPEDSSRRLQYKAGQISLMKDLIRMYALGDVSAELQAKLMKDWEICAACGGPELRLRLLQAELCRAWGQKAAGQKLLEAAAEQAQRESQQNITEYVWYLYLDGELNDNQESSMNFRKLLARYVYDDIVDADLFLLQLREDEVLQKDQEQILLKLREYHSRGQMTPALLMEACRLYNADPARLSRLDEFDRKVLMFGARNGCLSREAALRSAELIGEQKGYHAQWYRILKMFYMQYPEMPLLYGVCNLLIKGEKKQDIYHSWYAMGTAHDIQLPQLYDYYLYTLPDNFKQELPEMVLLYFSYHGPRDLKSKLTLYQNILAHYQPEDAMYQRYEKQMQEFALEQLLAGHAGRKLAPLYYRMFIPEVLDKKTADKLADYLYMYHITLRTHTISHVVVVYNEFQTEFIVPVRNREAFVPMYTKDCKLLFMDRDGIRYWTADYKKRRFMPASPEMQQACMQMAPNHKMLQLVRCHELLEQDLTAPETLAFLQHFLQRRDLYPRFRSQIMEKLIRAYAEGTDHAGEVFAMIKESPYLDEDTARMLIETQISRGENQAALELMERFGFRLVNTELLLRFCSQNIALRAQERDENILEIAEDLYRRQTYDDITLTYLCRYFNGSTREMYQVLDRASQGNAVFYDMPERLLAQMLFTGQYTHASEVFALYIKNSPRAEGLLVSAYLSVVSHLYFAEDKKMDGKVLEILKDRALDPEAEKMPAVCRLALLKYWSEQVVLDGAEKEQAAFMTAELAREGMVFSFMKKLSRFIALPPELQDKILVEYHGEPGRRMKIELRILPEQADAAVVSQDMDMPYPGIYTFRTLLFYGETLSYKIYQVSEAGKTLAEEGTREAEILENPIPDEFSRLNELLQDAGQGDSEQWQQQVVDYGIRNVMIQKYFNIIR